MELLFKRWLEDCGEVTSTYSNTLNAAFERTGIDSKYVGGKRNYERSKFDPNKIFNKRIKNGKPNSSNHI